MVYRDAAEVEVDAAVLTLPPIPVEEDTFPEARDGPRFGNSTKHTNGRR